MEVSRLLERRTCLGKSSFISSGILVVAGKYLYCFFDIKQERLAMMKFNCAIE